MGKEEMQNCCCGKKEVIKALLAVLTLFIIVLIVSNIVGIVNKIKEGRYIGQSGMSNSITVSGTGEAYIKPDLARVSLSVITEAKTVAQAMGENAKKMNAVIDYIKSQGIEEKDLKTTNFSIQPRYEYDNTEPYYTGKRTLVGYEAAQSLDVKIRNFEKIGAIVEGSTSAGANSVSDVQFTVENEDQAKNQAREEAVAKAKAKAETLSRQVGVKLLRVMSFYEDSGVSPYYFEDKLAPGMGGGESSVSPVIQPGQNKISVTVSITYEIR